MAEVIAGILREHALLQLNTAHPALMNQWAEHRLQGALRSRKLDVGWGVLHELVLADNEPQLGAVLASPHPFDLAKALADVSLGCTALTAAAAAGKVALVGTLLGAGASEVRQTGEPISALQRAIEGAHLGVVRLLAVGGGAPLHWALRAIAVGEHDESIRWAVFVHVARKSDVNAPSATGAQALLLAIEVLLPRCATWLLWQFPAIDVNNGFLADTVPLYSAAALGQVKVVAALLASRAALAVNWANTANQTALDAALQGGRVAVLRMLLADPRVSVTGRSGTHDHSIIHTAVFWALAKNMPELVECFVGREHVDWAAPDRAGATAIHLLLNTAPPPDPDADDEVDPLFLATASSILDILCAQGPAAVDMHTHAGTNAVSVCIVRGRSASTLRTLLRHSSSHLTGFVQDHPELLRAAAAAGQLQTCFILRACGYPVLLRNGDSANLLAARRGHMLLASALCLSAGMPQLQLAYHAGLTRDHVNTLVAQPNPAGGLGLDAAWTTPTRAIARPPHACPEAYLHLLRRSHGRWSRLLHSSRIPYPYRAATWTLLLCMHRLGIAGLPIEMCHLILTHCSRSHF